MPRIYYKRIVYHYSFVKPPIISKSQFDEQKKRINNDSNYSLTEPKDTKETNRTFMFMGIGLTLVVVGIICSSNDTQGVAGICIVASMFFLLPMLGGTFESAVNFNRAGNERIEYYYNLKEQIKNSQTYDIFISKYSKDEIARNAKRTIDKQVDNILKDMDKKNKRIFIYDNVLRVLIMKDL